MGKSSNPVATSILMSKPILPKVVSRGTLGNHKHSNRKKLKSRRKSPLGHHSSSMKNLHEDHRFTSGVGFYNPDKGLSLVLNRSPQWSMPKNPRDTLSGTLIQQGLMP